MKKFMFLLIVFLSVQNRSFCQERSGWYHLLSGAKTRVLMNFVSPKKDVSYGIDEVLLVFDFSSANAYAVDIDGRIIEITDTTKIKKITVAGKPVKMVQNVDISLTKRLSVDNNIWLVGFNSSLNTAKILLSNGEISEIPKDSYTDITQYYLYKAPDRPVNPVIEH